MKCTLSILLLLLCLAAAPAVQAENAAVKGPPAKPSEVPKYTSQTYVDTLKAELARLQTRLVRDKAEEKLKRPLESAIADGGKLQVIVQDLILAKKNIDGPEFLSAAAKYLQAKQQVPISWDDEAAHYTAWIEANKSDPTQAAAVKHYEQIVALLKRGKETAEKNNKMDAMSTQNQFNQLASTADSYHKNGSYKGLGPDTHKGEYILARLQGDPNVTIQIVEPTKRRRSTR